MMTSPPEPEPVTGPENAQKETNNKDKAKKEKKEKARKSPRKLKTEGVTDKELEPEEPKIKKKVAKAKEIEKTQAKRKVKPLRVKAKIIRQAGRATKATGKVRNIGVEVAPPLETCTDPFCPFHGTLSVRGQIINGVVVSSRMDKTAIIQREIKRYIPKFERYEKRTHRYAVHNPSCMNAQRGDLVRIMECRPLSKSKSFVIIEKS